MNPFINNLGGFVDDKMLYELQLYPLGYGGVEMMRFRVIPLHTSLHFQAQLVIP